MTNWDLKSEITNIVDNLLSHPISQLDSSFAFVNNARKRAYFSFCNFTIKK
jgi:hypothetical protein